MMIKDRPEYRSKPAPLTARADEMVQPAVQRMSDSNFGSIIVVDADGRVEGIVTERDIFRKLVAPAKDPAKTRLGEIMTSEVRSAADTDDLVDWLRIMSNERFRRLPVVDGDGRLVSVMSQGDFVSYTWPDLLNQAKTFARSTMDRRGNLVMVGAGILAYTIILVIVLTLLR